MPPPSSPIGAPDNDHTIHGHASFEGAARSAYLATLRAVLRPGGRYFMLGISDADDGRWGRVHKLGRDAVEAALSGWTLHRLEPSTIDITVAPGSVRAWFAAATRS